MRRSLRGVAWVGAVYLAAVFVAQRVDRLPGVRPAADPTVDPAGELLAGALAGNPAVGAPPDQPMVSGALHVHTEYSDDAVGTTAELAAAARSQDLGFVFVSDHQPDLSARLPAPRFEDGVLLMFGQERGLDREIGRVLVEGVDTVLSLGDTTDKLRVVASDPGVLAVISHPRSTSTVESWKSADAGGAHAWEAFNLDDALARRAGSLGALAHAVGLVVSQPLGRGSASLLRLYTNGFDEPGAAGFDSLYAREPITAVGALDSHPKIRLWGRLWPSYEMPMGTIANHVLLDGPLPESGPEAATAVRGGIRSGRVFISLGRTAEASRFRLSVARQGVPMATIGDTVPFEPALLTLRARVPAGPARILYRVVRDGRPLGWVRGPTLDWTVDSPGVYRVEVHTYGIAVGGLHWNLRPWIFTNPVRILPVPEAPIAAGSEASSTS